MLLGSVGSAGAQSLASHQPLYAVRSQQAVGSPLSETIKDIGRQHQVRFSFDRKMVEDKFVQDVLLTGGNLYETLDAVLTPFQLRYEMIDSVHFVIVPKAEPTKPLEKLESNALRAEEANRASPDRTVRRPTGRTEQVTTSLEKTITGTVTDLSTGETLPGVNIVVKGTTVGTVTDIDGNYRLTAPDDAQTLVFSSVGYASEEVAIGNQTVVNLEMAPDIQSLSEVVVVGYGEQSRRQVTSAISSVKAEEIENLPSASLDNLIQGRAAGVQVTQGSGQPGGAVTVRIRGNTSVQGGNEPLYVVDGIPIKSGTFDGLADGGAGSNALADINPSDIASIEILKDAAATSIYGSRAANGVVLITTKRGKAGGASIKFNYYRGVQEVTRTLSQVNAAQFRDYINESYTQANRPLDSRETDSLNTFYNNDFYWQSALFETAPISNYELSIGGGEEKINYFLSAGYFDQDGIVRNSQFKRFTSRANVEYKATENFRVGNTFTYSNTSTNRISEGPAFARGVIYRTLTRFPTDSPYDEEGNVLPNQPIATLLNSNQGAATNRIIGNVYAELDIIEGLTFRSSIALDLLSLKEDQFFPSTIRSFGGAQRTAATRYLQDLGWINENWLTYNTSFNEQHNLNLLLGFSQQKNTRERIIGNTSLSPTDLVPTLNAGAQKDDVATFETSNGIESYFARVNYDFQGKYIVSATARYDGSSRFGQDNRFGFFPSASLGWRVSDEGFMQNVAIIDDLKLRASWGITGNQDLPNFVAQGLYLTGRDYLGQGGIAPASDGLPNSELSWESTTQIDLGLDITILRNRISLVADYYVKNTDNLLFPVALPASSGFNSALINLGEIQNEGFEFALNTNNLTGAFKWSTSFNIGFNRNKVVSLPDGNDIQTNLSILRVGEPIGTFYGFQHLGVFATDADNVNELRLDSPNGAIYQGGDMEFLDVNGDNVINNSDRVIIGNANPDFTGGFTNNFSYKGFDLNIFMNFSYGNDLTNQARRDRDSHRLGNAGGPGTDVLRRWRNPGDVTDVPRVIRGDALKNFRDDSSYWIEDGSFLRIRNITLAYNFTPELISKIRLKSARLYTTVQNLRTFTNYQGYDPEVVSTSSNANGGNIQYGVDNGYYPLARSIIFGVNLGF